MEITTAMGSYQIDKLDRELRQLRLLMNDSARLEHAVYAYEPVSDRKCWVPFVPTRFIYSIFTFNMLCNIDWKDSIEVGRIIEFDSGLRDKSTGVSDSYKIREYLEFCFGDVDFVSSRKEWFADTVLGGMTADEILSELKKIQRDRDRYGRINNNGNVRAVSFIDNFYESVRSLLVESKFNSDNITNTYNFIYKIRCNIFHGVKTITEMMDPDQQTRLEIYSRFLYAANSIVFDYLQYIAERQ